MSSLQFERYQKFERVGFAYLKINDDFYKLEDPYKNLIKNERAYPELHITNYNICLEISGDYNIIEEERIRYIFIGRVFPIIYIPVKQSRDECYFKWIFKPDDWHTEINNAEELVLNVVKDRMLEIPAKHVNRNTLHIAVSDRLIFEELKTKRKQLVGQY